MKNTVKTRIIAVLFSLMMILCCLSVTMMKKNEGVVAMADTSTYVNVLSNERTRTSFNAGWKFIRSHVLGATETSFNDSNWETVSLPHTWNRDDCTTRSYYRGKAWYRKTFDVETKSAYAQANKRLWVEFEACGQYAEVYVNGQLVGEHIGGYSAFRFDITDFLSDTGNNTIAILADNSGNGSTISPFGMDFDIWGGLYRDAWLIETSGVMVDMEDYGSSGLYLSGTKNENSNNWNLNVSSKIVNASGQDVTVEAEIILRYPKRADMTWMDNSYDLSGTAAFAIGSEENPLRFDPDDMYETFETDAEYIVEKRTIPLTIKANEAASISEDINVVNPKLWNGVYSPYRYIAEINIKVNDVVVDNVKEFYGFRYFEVNEKGFFLNGEKYQLNGANKHQDFGGVDANGTAIGFATTDREKYVDLCIAYEMGTTYLRLVHYPHDKAIFDMCDAYGIVTSGELALGGSIGGSSSYDQNDPVTVEFFDNVKLQLTELVKQLHNNPSVIVWGLQNETNVKYYDTMAYYMRELNDLAHDLDGNHRYTTQAICVDGQVGWETDLICWNTYPNWYFNFSYMERITELYEDLLNDPRYANYLGLGISEYGAGANVLHHSEVLEWPSTAGQWHPEEWSNYVHEDALLALENIDYLWENSPWQLFDSVSAGRNEGDLPGINDKGLVNYERTIKKDVFYLYKANYSDFPFVYIAEKRNNPRTLDEMQVKCYSNAESITLYKMKGSEKTLVGEMQYLGAGIFVSEKLALDAGSNVFVAEFTEGGKVYTDTCEFTREMSADTSLKSDIFKIDNEKKTITLSKTSTVQEIMNGEITTSSINATFRIVDSFLNEVTDMNALIVPSMKVEVTAENGKIALYDFVSQSIVMGKTFSASVSGSDLGALNDGNALSKWSGNGSSATVIVDLEKEFRLTNITINWYTAYTNRQYYYRVSVSTDGINYTEVVDRTDYSLTLDTTKTESIITDDLNEVVARYLKIEIVGCNLPVNRVEINEIEVLGWNITSDEATVDHENRVIVWNNPPETQDEMYADKLLALLNITGNATYTITEGEAALAYYLMEGNYLVITDGAGKEINYYICIDCGEKHDSSKLITNVKAEASTSLNEFFVADKLIDGDLTSKWVGNRADYNDAWVLLTLDNSTLVSKVEIVFENDGVRAYDFSVYASNTGTRKDDFKLVKQVIDNQNVSGIELLEINAEIRYLRIVVWGCNQENVSPSIREVELYGYEKNVVTFVVNGGNPIPATKYGVGEKVDVIPTKIGYTFDGWYLDENFETPFDGMVATNTTLYAKWVEIKEDLKEEEDVIITFVFNNGVENLARTGKCGDSIVLPVPTREGFEFVGWFADEACTVLVNFDKLPNQSCTLYAKWVEKDTGSGCSGNIANGGIALLGILSMGVGIILFRRKKVQ